MEQETVQVKQQPTGAHLAACTCGWQGKRARRWRSIAVHEAHMHSTTTPGHQPAVPLVVA